MTVAAPGAQRRAVMRTNESSVTERRPESGSPATRHPATRTDAEIGREARSLWKQVAMVLGVAAIVALEILFLRFGPSLYISAYTIVLVFLGLLVLAVFAGEVLSWVLFAQSLTRRFRRD